MLVLITGASGFIGSNLTRALLTDTSIRVRAASRTLRVWPDGVEGCVVSPGDDTALASACRGVEAVVNLASMSEGACASAPFEALRVNGGGMLALARAASAAGVRRLVHLSTYKVYGNVPSGAVTEDSPPRPTSHYAITHRLAEDYAASLHPNTVIFRLANGFGAPAVPSDAAWGLIVNGMCREAAVSRTITIRSSGLGWRNFVPIADVLQALRTATANLPGGTYNLGSRESLTLRAMAARVADACATALGFLPAVVVSVDRDEAEHPPLDFRVTKLARAGVEPLASIDDELARTLRVARETFANAPNA